MKTKLLTLFLFLLIVFGAKSQIPTNGLVAYYPFNGNANDESGNGNNGTDLVGGVSFVTGKYGQAAKFGGYSNPGHIHVPNSISLKFTNGASFVYWVRLDDAAGMDGWGSLSANGNQCAFAKSHDRSGIYNNMGYNNQNRLYSGLSSSNGGGVGSRVQGISYTIGSWIQIAYTCSSNKCTLYVNGVQEASINTPISFSTSNSQDLYFGKYSDSWYPLNGALDEMRIYNRQLNATEIQQLYNNFTSFDNTSTITPSTEIIPTVNDIITTDPKIDFSKSKYRLPENKYDDTYNFDKLKNFLQSKEGYNFAWNNNSFTNPVFATNIENGTVENTFGMDFFYRQFFWTTMFADYDFSFSSYNRDITQYALKVSLSTILFPTTPLFLPSVGVGYQIASLQIPAPESSKDTYTSSSNTCGLFWKVGVQSFISSKFSLHFEYAQTLFNERKSASMISLGLGIYIK
ncbi:MAG: LamG domain-containing protein [Paludibacter sp.]